MSKVIIDIIYYLVEAVVFWLFCEKAFKAKNKVLSFTLTLLAYAAMFCIGLMRINYLNIVSTIIFHFLLMLFCFKTKPLIAIVFTILIEGSIAASEYIAIPILAAILGKHFNDFATDDWFYLVAAIISKSILILSYFAYLKLYKKHNNSFDNTGYGFILLISISNISLFMLIQYLSNGMTPNVQLYVVWAISAIFFYVASFLTLNYRNFMISKTNQISELTIENQKKELDEQYFSVLEKSNDDMQILAHDFKNHLSYVRHLDSAEEKDKYIDKVYPEIEKFQQTASTGNNTLDVILSKYTSICALKAIDFKTDVKNANLAQVESVDLIALLYNLLDNAVEAAETSAAKRITLTLVKDT